MKIRTLAAATALAVTTGLGSATAADAAPQARSTAFTAATTSTASSASTTSTASTTSGSPARSADLETAALVGAVASGSPAAIGTMRRSLSAAAHSAYLGSRLSGLVVDRASGDVVWSYQASRTRMPASTQKLLTTYTVLHSMRASTRIETRALQSKANPGNLYLRGEGDPSLTSARLKSLARAASRQLKAQGRSSVTLYVDDRALPAPSLATGWKRSYISGREVQWVRGLTLAGYRGTDGALAAGRAFRAHLKTYGISVRSLGRGTAPTTRREVGSTASGTVGSLLGTMLRVSNNDYAEHLLRFAALKAGASTGWSGALAHQRAVLARGGVATKGYRAYDGSGLSRADRMPAGTLTSVIRKLYADQTTRPVVFAWNGMPRAGQTGTLRSRFRTGASKCAAGKVVAKTGTLGDVVSLAGIAHGTDGRDRVFAFLENGSSNTAGTRGAIDTLAAVTVGCRR